MFIRFLQNFRLLLTGSEIDPAGQIAVVHQERFLEAGKIIEILDIVYKETAIALIMTDQSFSQDIPVGSVEILGVPKTTVSTACCSNKS
jgi:hypothetical protein